MREGGYELPIVKGECEVGFSKLDDEGEGAVGLRGPGLLKEDVLMVSLAFLGGNGGGMPGGGETFTKSETADAAGEGERDTTGAIG